MHLYGQCGRSRPCLQPLRARLRTRTTPAGPGQSRDTDGHGSVAVCRVEDRFVELLQTDCGSGSGIQPEPEDERETLVVGHCCLAKRKGPDRA